LYSIIDNYFLQIFILSESNIYISSLIEMKIRILHIYYFLDIIHDREGRHRFHFSSVRSMMRNIIHIIVQYKLSDFGHFSSLAKYCRYISSQLELVLRRAAGPNRLKIFLVTRSQHYFFSNQSRQMSRAMSESADSRLIFSRIEGFAVEEVANKKLYLR
jgi:hypothetical protein